MRICLFICSVLSVYAEVKLPQSSSDQHVLQRRMPTRIWGTASPGEKISLNWIHRAQRVANIRRWSAALLRTKRAPYD